MKHKFNVLCILAGLIVLTISSGALAYPVFSGSNNCNQCHTDFDGFGAALHNFHLTFASCSDCHVINGDNPVTDRCIDCHDDNGIKSFHVVNVGPDGNGFTCLTCHTVTPNDTWSWSQTKHLFK